MAGLLHSTGSTEITFSLMQFAPHRTIVHTVAVIPDNKNTSTLKHGTDMIIGRDLIKNHGLVLNTVPMLLQSHGMTLQYQ
jgi:hypothetical protein